MIGRASGLIFSVPALLILSILTPLFLPSMSVSLSYLILEVTMHECLGKHLCTSSPFPIAISHFVYCMVPSFAKQDDLLGRRVACQKDVIIILGCSDCICNGSFDVI